MPARCWSGQPRAPPRRGTASQPALWSPRWPGAGGLPLHLAPLDPQAGWPLPGGWPRRRKRWRALPPTSWPPPPRSSSCWRLGAGAGWPASQPLAQPPLRSSTRRPALRVARAQNWVTAAAPQSVQGGFTFTGSWVELPAADAAATAGFRLGSARGRSPPQPHTYPVARAHWAIKSKFRAKPLPHQSCLLLALLEHSFLCQTILETCLPLLAAILTSAVSILSALSRSPKIEAQASFFFSKTCPWGLTAPSKALIRQAYRPWSW